jgi:hypothetical protein
MFAPGEHAASWMLARFVEATWRGYLIFALQASGSRCTN